MIESASTLKPGEVGVGNEFVKGLGSQKLPDVVKRGIRDVGPELIGSSVLAVRQGNSAAVLGFVEVDSLGNDRGNSWAVETGLSPECEDSEG